MTYADDAVASLALGHTVSFPAASAQAERDVLRAISRYYVHFGDLLDRRSTRAQCSSRFASAQATTRSPSSRLPAVKRELASRHR